MSDDYCGADANYANNDNYTSNDTTVTYENTSITNQDVVYSSNVVIEDNGPLNTCADNFYIGDCSTIYDGGFQPAPTYHVGIETFSIGGGVQQPYYDPGFHTISIDSVEPYYVEPPPQVYPVYSTDTTLTNIFIFIILFAILAIFVVMGKIFVSKVFSAILNSHSDFYSRIYFFVF